MNVTVQVVTRTDDGQESIREVACVEREDLTPATLGLSLAEGKWCFRPFKRSSWSGRCMRT